MRDRTASPHIKHYLDDFLLAGPGGMSSCTEWLRAFQELAAELGVPLAKEKTERPATRLTFLGIRLDAVQGLFSLPQEKLVVLRELLTLEKEKCTLKQFQ